ncbi:MAG: hypothetical protein A2Y17_08885 [Clostridiales bacterium GWF2_38_85]|nr:MAG: hypothetical protein A2Y17_08885 [Clostridiales bacterium GWF2_38_85]HBL83689.1 hypothetical protein [Clostridiales bacterium]
MKTKKFSAFIILLAIVFILPLIAACDNDDTSSASSTSEESVVSETSDSSRKSAKDNLPDRDFEDKDFVIFCRSEHEYEFAAEELNNEFINDTIYNRNSKVEERYNVNIKTFAVDGDWGVHTQFFTTLKSYLQSGADDFQLIAGYAAVIPTMVSGGIFYNWKDIDYIDFDQPWWSEDLNDELTINDKLYLLTGDISLTLWENMCAMFYNKDLATEYNLPDLYQMVRDGDWTFDEMAIFAKQACKDLNGDSQWTKDDQFGYISAKTTQVDVYLNAFDLPVTTKNSENIPEFTINQSKTYSIVQKLYDFLCESDDTYTTFSLDNEQYEMFGAEQSLFMPGPLKWGDYLNGYEFDYGILPMPKYDTNQEGYYTTSIDNYSMLAVPNTVVDTEFVGIITEALCAESYRSVVEEYYNTMLQNRYARDEQSAEMIDIVREGLRFNFGYVYSYTLDWPAHQVNICINSGTPEFASLWQSKESMFEKNLETQLSIYLED